MPALQYRPAVNPRLPQARLRSCLLAGSGRKVFAGQRADGFYVDLGAIFDLGNLRPLANLHATFGLPKLAASKGVNSTRHLNVHSIAIQVPITDLTKGGVTPRVLSTLQPPSGFGRRQAVTRRGFGTTPTRPSPTAALGSKSPGWATPLSTR